MQDIIDLLATKSLPWPDHIIGGVGTQIYDGRQKRSFSEYNKLFRQGWDLKKIESVVSAFPGVTHQPPQFLHPYKSSWYLDKAPPETIEQLKQLLVKAGLEVNVVYSSMRDLDLLPQKTNKGGALQWLCEKLQIPLANVLVAGDTGNDSSMFLLPGVRGIVVENAQPELFEAVVHLPTFSADQVMADGVIEGLRHFGVVPQTPSLESSALRGSEIDPTLRMLFTEAALGTLTSEERQLICTGYDQALIALRKNITPLGFSACSLDDNAVTGTDANYRSVWARDGAITLISTLELEDPQIRDGQRATLRTLLDHDVPERPDPGQRAHRRRHARLLRRRAHLRH